GLVEDFQAGTLADQAQVFDQRIAARVRDTRIQHFDDDIDHLHGLGRFFARHIHVTWKPLDGHSGTDSWVAAPSSVWLSSHPSILVVISFPLIEHERAGLVLIARPVRWAFPAPFKDQSKTSVRHCLPAMRVRWLILWLARFGRLCYRSHRFASDKLEIHYINADVPR